MFRLAIAFCFLASASADFISKSIGSNMVLQRNKVSSVYGFVEASNVTVNCTLDTVDYYAEVSEYGSAEGTFFWKCEFPEFPGGFDEYTIDIVSSSGERAMIENVVFGDVFMCGGQSNMEFSMPGMSDADTEIPDADNFPYLRILSVGEDTTSPFSEIPLDDLWSVEVPWSVGSAAVMQNAESDAFDYFSSVCYMTGKYIFTDLLDNGIPIGLISSNWGGSIIETWMTSEGISACGDTPTANKPSSQFITNPATVGDSYTSTPSVNFNNMIYPFKDMSFVAVLWYQGESNTGLNTDLYDCLQANMMDAWRSMGSGWNDISLLFVQLAPWAAGGTSAIADMRFTQYLATFHDTNSFMVSAADLGDPDSPYGDIHPRYKNEVGRRLSLAASTVLYGKPVPHSGPIVTSAGVLDDGSFGAYLLFDADTIGPNGLHLSDAQTCPDPTVCGYHYLMYDSGAVLVDTDSMTIQDNKLIMYPSEPQTDVPTQVMYGYNDYPMLTIYNSYDLPLIPFVIPLPFSSNVFIKDLMKSRPH